MVLGAAVLMGNTEQGGEGGFPCNCTISTLLPASRHTEQKRSNKYLLHPCPSLRQEMDEYNILVLLSTPKTVVTAAPGESKKEERGHEASLAWQR